MAGTVYDIRKEGNKIYGFSYGCGCCGGEVEMSRKDLEEELELLKEEVAKIEALLAE